MRLEVGSILRIIIIQSVKMIELTGKIIAGWYGCCNGRRCQVHHRVQTIQLLFSSMCLGDLLMKTMNVWVTPKVHHQQKEILESPAVRMVVKTVLIPQSVKIIVWWWRSHNSKSMVLTITRMRSLNMIVGETLIYLCVVNGLYMRGIGKIGSKKTTMNV